MRARHAVAASIPLTLSLWLELGLSSLGACAPVAQAPRTAGTQARGSLAPGETAPSVQARNDGAALGASVGPCGRAGCPVEIRFDQPVAAAGDVGKPPAGEARFDPPQPGRFVWAARDRLVFQPAPGALPWGARPTLHLAGFRGQDGAALAPAWHRKVWVPRFQVGDKVARWAVTPGVPRLVGAVHRGRVLMTAGGVTLLYDQPVDPDQVARSLSLRVASAPDVPSTNATAASPPPPRTTTPIPVQVDRPPELGPALGSVGGDAGAVQLAQLVRVRAAVPLAQGVEVVVAAPSWRVDGSAATGGSHPPTLTSVRATVVRAVRLSADQPTVRAQTDDELSLRWTLQLTPSVAPDALRAHLHVDPPIPGLRVQVWDTQGGSHVEVRGPASPAVAYSLRVDEGLRDVWGDPLAAPTVAGVTAPHLPPRVRLPADRLIVPVQRTLAGPVAGAGGLPVEVRNALRVHARAIPLTGPEAFVAARRAGAAARCADLVTAEHLTSAHARQWELDTSTAPPDVPVVRALPGAPPGLYCLEVQITPRSQRAAHVNPTPPLTLARAVVVSELGLTAKLWRGGGLAWVTRLRDAKPVPGALVRVYDESGRRLGAARTDRVGAASLPTLGDVDPAARPGQRLYVAARRRGRWSVAEVHTTDMAAPWQFGLPSSVPGHAPLVASLFTDRGVYRPGDVVHLAGIFRRGADRRLPLPKGTSVHVRVSDSRGGVVWERDEVVARLGLSAWEIPLRAGGDAPTGRYQVLVTRARTTHGGATVEQEARASFLVEEYRAPAFRVEVLRAGDAWSFGRRAHAVVRARYHRGDALAGRRVRWRLVRRPVPVEAQGVRGFRFAGDPVVGPGRSEAAGGQRWARPNGRAAGAAELVTAGFGRLDGQGTLALDFLLAGEPGGEPVGPWRYTLEADVDDVDSQRASGRLGEVVHPRQVYVGLRGPVQGQGPRPGAAQGAVVDAAGDVEVAVVTVGTHGALRAGHPVEVALERVDRLGATRLTASGPQRVGFDRPAVVARCRVTSARAPSPCTLKLDGPGRYRVRAWLATPGQAPPPSQTPVLALVAAGEGVAAWPRFAHARVDVVPDQPRYRAGDTARLVVESPFPQATALVTLERDGVLEHRVLRLEGNAPVVEVPLTARAAPAVYASVVLARGGSDGAAGSPAAFRVGYAALRVVPADGEAQLDVRPSLAAARPGAAITLHIQGRTGRGAPLGGGRVRLWAVDEAVLALTDYKTPRPTRDLSRPAPLGVRTEDGRLDLMEVLRARHEALFTAGGGDDEWGEDDDPASADRSSPTLRRDAPTTAFVRDVVLDDSGRGSVPWTLPTALTRWRIMAVAVGPAGRVGAADAGVDVRQPVMAQPVVPRFLRRGDEVLLGARVTNATEHEGLVRVRFQVDGAAPRSGAALTVERAVGAGKTALVDLPVRLPATGSSEVVRLRARVTLGESNEDQQDGFEVTVPVRDTGAARKVVATGLAAGGGTARVEVELPAGRLAGSERLDVAVSSSPLSQLKQAVGYVMGYPHGCIEQTTSTAYPLLVLRDLLPEVGVEVDPAAVRRFAEAGVKRLLGFQTTSGGLAYWPGKDQPHAFGTAFALTALVEAKRQGYDVPAMALSRAAGYLESVLRRGKIQEEMPHAAMADGDTRALIALTLGRLGRPQGAELDHLWQARDKLTAFGLAFVAVAAGEGAGAGKTSVRPALVEPALAAVAEAARRDASEAWYDGRRGHGWSFDSPLRTHAGALLAFAATKPGAALTPKLLRGLLQRTVAGMWGNTQENVFGIMAVTTLVRASQRGGAPGRGAAAGAPHALRATPGLTLDGKAIPASALTPVTRALHAGRWSARGLASLGIKPPSPGTSWRLPVELRAPASAPAFVTVTARFDEPLTRAERSPHAQGLRVRRRTEVDGAPASWLALGATARVHLTVEATEVQHYVALDDPLPAGLEAVNARLATTAQVGPKHPHKLSQALARGLAAVSHRELRDDRVSYYFDALPPGRYEVVYEVRATRPGDFLRPAARAEAMYDPDVWGRGATTRLEVR